MGSDVPSEVPSQVPSEVPSNVPSEVPSRNPSFYPSLEPTIIPSTVCSQLGDLVPFKLEIQLDDQNGSEYGWNLVNELDGSGWEGEFNSSTSPDGILEYTMC